jgi:hypothetical protein
MGPEPRGDPADAAIVKLRGCRRIIRGYLDARHADPKPFRWTVPADTIIGKRQRGKRQLEPVKYFRSGSA